MFSSYIYRIAIRYFFSKDSKTIINRINNYAFIMIVASSSVLLIVLSAFSGLKNFGLLYTSSFDPELKVVPEKGKYFVLNDDFFNKLKELSYIEKFSPVIEEKVILSNELNSGAVILKGVLPDYYLKNTLDSLSLIGNFSSNENSLFIGASLASSLEVVMSEEFSLLATAAKNESNSLFSFSPFNSSKLEIVGIYQISSDIEKKYAFTPLKTLSRLTGVGDGSFTSIEMVLNGSVEKIDLEEELNKMMGVRVNILTREDLNPALYKMLNTENLAVYLIFSLVALIAMFNLVGSISIMIVEKTKDLSVLTALGAKSGDFNKIFFFLGVFSSFVGSSIGISIAIVIALLQNSYSLIVVPGTSIPYPVTVSLTNIIIVFFTINSLGVLTSAWSSRTRLLA